MNSIPDIATLDRTVRRAVERVRIKDIHTHLFPPSHGRLLLWGVDEMLTYHYLVAELFTLAPAALTPEAFWRLPKARQADLVWEHVFLRGGAMSEAARGVITSLNTLGLDVAGRDLAGIRRWFAGRKIEDHLPKVFDLANIEYAVMTNNPFAAEEAGYWDERRPCPPSLKTALRIDALLTDWPAAARVMRAGGYRASARGGSAGHAGARKFLRDWAACLKPLYLAASLGADFVYPPSAILDQVVLPVAAELDLPLALMIGVRRSANPALKDAGDAVGEADVSAVANLCRKHPDVKFLVTLLSPVNQHELCVTARKFRNLHVFGCWWFCNTPSIVEALTRMRIELLGTAFTCQHSDARVLEQVLYKWSHTRQVLAGVLAEKYRLQFQAGWRPSEDEIRRDVQALCGGRFEEFCAK